MASYKKITESTESTPGQFDYADLAKPVTLAANHSYYLLSSESSGGDKWYNQDTILNTTGDLTITNAVYSADSKTFTLGNTGNSAFGPVDLKYSLSSAPLGNPDAPVDHAPNVTGSDPNAVYLQPGASISQDVTFSGGWADLTLFATQTVKWDGSHGLIITLTPIDGGPAINNGQPLGASEAPGYGLAGYSESQNAYVWSRTAAFYTGNQPYTYKITLTSTLTSGTVFVDNLGIQTVNGIFKEVAAKGQPNISTVQQDVAIDRQFGLHDVGYEGGFDFNQNLSGYLDENGYRDRGSRGYSSGVPNVGMYANLDPRTVQLAINTLTQFYQDGGALPMIFQSTGNNNSWGVAAPSLYSALTETTSIPKVEAVVTMGQSLPPTPTYGTPAPGSVAAPAYDWQSPGKRLNEIFLVGAPGMYNVGFTIGTTNNGSTGTLQILVDGQLIGSVNVNDHSKSPYTLPVYLSAGQHSVMIVDTAETSGPYFGLELASVVVQSTGQVNLSSSYNQTGIYVDNSTFASNGGFAGDGFAISSNVLGNGLTWNGQPFNFGPVGANDVVSAAGQTIALPQTKAAALYFLGAAVYGNQTNQTFTVTYTDGTTQTFTQSMSDWYNGLQGFAGESVAVAMPYATLFNDSKFNHDYFSLYGYSFALDPSKTVQSITLPNNSHVKIVAMTVSPDSPVTQVNLSGSYNQVGIVNDGSTFSGGGLDNDGNALSANALGSSVTWNNQTYALGTAGSNNVVQASGQTIALPQGNYATLSFLAVGVNGNQPNQTFTVTYTDGTTQTFTQSLSDWAIPLNYPGESIVATMPYRDVSNGTKQNGSFHVYGYRFALNPSKTVQSIILPTNGNVELLAIDLS